MAEDITEWYAAFTMRSLCVSLGCEVGALVGVGTDGGDGSTLHGASRFGMSAA